MANRRETVNIRLVTTPRRGNDRMFRTLYFHGAVAYAKKLPGYIRRLIEATVLVTAMFALFVLAERHLAFQRDPPTCLDHVDRSLLRRGILRVDVVRTLNRNYTLEMSYETEKKLKLNQRTNRLSKELLKNVYVIYNGLLQIKEYSLDNMNTSQIETNRRAREAELSESNALGSTVFMMEYALDIGILKMDKNTRRKLNISVTLVALDPDIDECFGNGLSRMLLEEVLGYNELLISSIRTLAIKEGGIGYLKKLNSDEYYQFNFMICNSYVSLVVALLVMYLYIVIVSVIAAYANRINLVNPTLNIFATILLVMLALNGVDSMMDFYFNDNSTGFYMIVIIWCANKFDTICSHTPMTKRHWLRFFYLYLYMFYAYNCKYKGQYSDVALVATYLLILHSMVYFFHHYELPVILNAQRVMVMYQQMLTSRHLQPQANPVVFNVHM